MDEATPRIFSGIKPSGDLHLGNYLGAIKRFVQMQHQIPSIYCVVDMHAITVKQDPVDLRRWTYEVAAAYIAAGVDPARSIIFNQSRVHQHAELAWVLNCVARMGWMERMTQFKDKAGANSEHVSLGLFAYPALMAADILLYRATHVPVGEDQKQHVELARDIAQKFNNDFRPLFPLPEPVIQGVATRVMSLRDGTKKMSKSEPSDFATIYLTDSTDEIARKIKRAKTDMLPLPAAPDGLVGRPEASNLVSIYAALTDQTVAQVLVEFAGAGWPVFKPKLVDLLAAVLGPISARMRELLDDRGELDRVLTFGAARAAHLAEPVMLEVYAAVGFVRAHS
jgi:tryptophanyl-tRNA synthetase